MRTWLLITLLTLGLPAQAARLDGCNTTVRLGQHLIHVGDDRSRTLRTIERAAHRVRWASGRTSSRWTLQVGAHNPRTVHIQFKEGRIARLCQYAG